MASLRLERIPTASAAAGGVIWVTALAGTALLPGRPAVAPGPVRSILMLAVLVVVPLALRVTATPDRGGRHGAPWRTAVRLQPIAALPAAASFFLPAGAAAATLVVPWTATTAVAAVYGLWRLLPRGTRPWEELAIDAGWLYLAVGGAWLLASQGGYRPFGFEGPIVDLTAAHFHYIPVALITTGMVGRLAGQRGFGARIYRRLVPVVILAPALVALGIAYDPVLETVGGVLLSVAMTAIALLGLLKVSALRSAGARGMVGASLVALAGAMGLALLYALRRAIGPVLGVDAMVATHGWINALGVGALGMIGWSLATPPSRAPRPGIPFSRLRSRGRVGADFFAREGLEETAAPGEPGNPPGGLVDDMEEYRGKDFDPDRLPAPVRRFYERTAAYDLLVTPVWRPGLRWLGRAYRRVGRRLEQMNLPVASKRDPEEIDSRIASVRDEADGRENVRAWVRAYRASGRALYAAAYAHHTAGDRTYMNIAFPMPGGSVTSVLRLSLEEAVGAPGREARQAPALALTSLPAANGPGDEGVYFVLPWLPLRLPVNETIRVCAAGDRDFSLPAKMTLPPEATVVARHEMWVFGVRLVTLYYAITDR